LNVYLVTGEYLGVVEEILPTGSNDVYVVKDKSKEYLIPAIHSIIKDIDVSRKKMIISPVNGLLDLS